MLLILYICIIVSVAVADFSDEIPNYDISQAEQLFEEFIAKYGKVYLDAEEKRERLEIFKENLKLINEKNTIGGLVYQINHLSDLSLEEFVQQYLGSFPTSGDDECEVKPKPVTQDLPSSLNWVEKGAVTPVKDQGRCGSCWAFATIANIESQYILHEKDTKIFSEQMLVDCSKRNNGCLGGLASTAMSDIMDLGGVELQSDYPYEMLMRNCRFDKSKVATNIAGCTSYSIDQEEDLKHVLAEKGPVAVSLYGVPLQSLHHIKKVIPKEHCPDFVAKLIHDSLGLHAVLLVGYGTDENGQDYWMLKNSWGTMFGEDGYIRIARGNNTCGIMHVTLLETGEVFKMSVTTAEL